jgi:hypothetical protein
VRNMDKTHSGHVFLARALFAYIAVLTVLLLPVKASADSIRGLLDLNYNNTTIKTVDPFGVHSKIKADGFQQRYNLTFDKSIYPSVVLSGGGLFEDSRINSTTDGEKTKTNAQRLSPYVDLIMNTPFISSGIGYRRREDSASSNGDDSPKEIQELYSANLGWRPSDLPSLNFFYTKRFLYDEFRLSRDLETDNFTWISDYRAIKGLELNYSGNYSLQKDGINDSKTDSLLNNGRIAYSGNALNNRVLYSTSYSIAMQDTTITANGAAGGTFFLATPTAGSKLFAVTPTVLTTVTNGSLQPSAAPVNLVAPLPLPATQNNFGLSFSDNTQMDTIFLSITSKPDPSNPTVRTPPTVPDLNAFYTANSASFSFLIYTSDDGINWGPFLGIATTVTVGRNPANPASDEAGFIVSFPQQTTGFIKVVQTPPLVFPTSPILPTIDPRSIYVVNSQAFRTVRISEPGKSITSSNISGIYDLNVKALLLDDPSLVYDLTYTYTHNKSDQSSLTTTYLLNNGLNFIQIYREIWTVSARVTDELSSDSQDKIRNAISYNAGVNVAPLPTLNHSLVYGGRVEFFEGKSKVSNTIYQNNSAELYRGLSVNLGAGYTNATSETNQKTDSISITVGAEITPNRDFTLNLSYQDLSSNQSGGGQPARSSFNRTAAATATYRLSDALYLNGGYSLFMQNDQKNVTLQNYGVAWSPFRGGDLQFNFAFSESYDSGDKKKDRNISPSLRWNIRQGSTFDISYNLLDSKSDSSGKVDLESFAAQLRITF